MTDPLRSYENFQASIREFSWLQDVVPGAMDVDILIERHGHFLVVEGKPWRKGVVLPYGQHRALYQMSLLPNFQVYLVGEDGNDLHVALYNDAPAPLYWRRTSESFWPPERFIKTDKAKMADIVRAWWNSHG